MDINELKRMADETQDEYLKAGLLKRIAAMEQGSSKTSDYAEDFEAFAKMLMSDAGLSEDEVITLAKRVFSQSQVTMSQLAPEVVDLINRTKSVTLTVNTIGNSGIISSVKNNTKQMKNIFWVILSDMLAGNNVYLYGSAGTGKTFIAKQAAKAINYDVITINCNQFTSPLEIIGGQTIDGYQRGKLERAWGNIELGVNPATGKPYSGALLLIDELPKLDPNTAGVLNEALSLIKDPVEFANGAIVPKFIYNGANEKIAMQRIFIVATGNTLLLRPDPNYSANFAQDASLQDRFAGSTYRMQYDYNFEYNEMLKMRQVKLSNGMEYDEINMAFLFNFLMRLREAIDKLGFNNEAFISARIINNLKDTYIQFRMNAEMPKDEQIPRPKTLGDGILSFFKLFTDIQQENINMELQTSMGMSVEDYVKVVLPEVDLRPLDNLSTDAEIQTAEEIVAKFNSLYGDKIM